MTERAYLYAAEVAALFRVGSKTVARWAAEGKLPSMKTLGGHRRYPRKEIEALANKPERKR